jgi:hypothetical protein
MTREEIIRIAQEAGLRVGTNLSGVVLVGSPAEIGLTHLTIEELERFAALVAAAEREACAKVCEDMDHNGVMIAADCATAIRARK